MSLRRPDSFAPAKTLQILTKIVIRFASLRKTRTWPLNSFVNRTFAGIR
jgi:hypothetical protein